jgi:cytochrome P450
LRSISDGEFAMPKRPDKRTDVLDRLERVDIGEPDAFGSSDSFNLVVGGDVRDPYPELNYEREHYGVLERDITPVSGVVERDRIFTVYRYDDVDAVLRDPETFTSKTYEAAMGPVMGRPILAMDPPEHTVQRGLVNRAFRKRALATWEARVITPKVHELIDAFAGRGSADLMREFSVPFPVQVIAGILGLPMDDYPQFLQWAMDLIAWTADYEKGLAASVALTEYFAGIMAQRRSDPRDDVISDLVHAEVDGEHLSDEEIYSFLRLLLPAGAETTARSFGNLMFGLLTHPDQLAAVRDDRSLVKQAIEEAVRWEGPLLFIQRGVTKDTVICGHAIPAGATLSVCVGSANRDPRKFDRPDEFDIHRPLTQHLAFGSGPHMCLGQQLARVEMTVALNAVLDRLPDIRLDPAWDDPHISGFIFRSPRKLPVLF